jgi:hypothetical protein
MKQRKSRIEILLSDEEKVRLKKAAAEARMSLSDYCLNIILSGQVVAPFSPDELKQMVSLTGMANNLNQMVKKAHQEKWHPARIQDLELIIDRLKQLLK